MCRRLLIPLGVLLFLVGCTEPDETVNLTIGTTRPSLADVDLATQTVEVGVGVPRTIQTFLWNDVAKFEVSGLNRDDPAEKFDLTFGEDCAFIDTAVAPVLFDGACGGGLIVNSDMDTEPRTVMVESIELMDVMVFRLEPIILPETADYDGDGVMNAADNCVLVDNPDQEDTGMKGFGDACTGFDPFIGIAFVDNDADGVVDIIDNCPFTFNPLQADDGIPFGDGRVPDGIGNACSAREQRATVDGGTIIFDQNDSLTAMGVQPLRGNSWLTLDFNDQAALDCDWIAGSCTLTKSAVKFCFSIAGGFSCP